MVIATQNPIEHEGTYPLPESQLDRFLMRLRMGYPGRDAELEILETHGGHDTTIEELEPVATGSDVVAMAEIAQNVHVAPSLRGYVVDLAARSRAHPDLALGLSPRAALGLQRAARAMAAAAGRDYVVPDDIKIVAEPVLEHRLVPTPDAQLQGASPGDILRDVLAGVPVPTGRGG